MQSLNPFQSHDDFDQASFLNQFMANGTNISKEADVNAAVDLKIGSLKIASIIT